MNISLLSSLQKLAKPNGDGLLPQLQSIVTPDGRSAANVIDLAEARAKLKDCHARREMQHVR